MEGECKIHFSPVNVIYRELGKYLKMMIKRIHTTIGKICKLSNLSATTFERLTQGIEYPLNFYWRLKKAFLHEIKKEEDQKEFLIHCDEYITSAICLNYSFDKNDSFCTSGHPIQ